jgi:hypothetical protein
MSEEDDDALECERGRRKVGVVRGRDDAPSSSPREDMSSTNDGREDMEWSEMQRIAGG